MAKRKRTTSRARRSFKKRRTYRARRKVRARISSKLGLPESKLVRMRYVEFISLDAGIGVPAYDTLSATSLFDPYVGTGGHQPMGFDEMSAWYENYQVMGATATAHARVYASAAADAIWLIGQTSNDTSAPASTIEQYIEQKDVKYAFLTSAIGANNTGKVTVRYSPRKQFAIKDPRDDQDLRAATTASPFKNAYFQFAVGGDNPADNPTAVNIRVVIDYLVLFTGRKHLAQS